MKNKFLATAAVLLFFLAALGTYTLVLLIRQDVPAAQTATELPACAEKDARVLLELFEGIPMDPLPEELPVKGYFEGDCLPDISSIVREIRRLKARMPASEPPLEGIYQQLLTTGLLQHRQPDRSELTAWVRWAAGFKETQGVLEDDLARSFRAIHFFWFTRINGYITEWVAADEAFKYSFDYRFAEKIMARDKFYLSTSKTAVEKIIQYLGEQRYGYLLNRFWYGTGALFKVGLVIGGLLLLTISNLFLNNISNKISKP